MAVRECPGFWRAIVSKRVSPRKLEVEEGANFLNESEWEVCVICDKPTVRWLQPENVPLCSDECKEKYLANPKIYDPRGIYAECGDSQSRDDASEGPGPKIH